jgi:uncharacterized protein YlxW (UPF0749 family)
MKIRMILFTFVSTMIGLFVAIQVQSNNEPDSRDTRNMGELRQALISQKETQQKLNDELDRQMDILYQLEQTEDIELVMEDVMGDLEEDAGLTEVSGSGLLIELNIVFDEFYTGGGIQSVPPYLLRLLINELNIQGAKHISIGNQRIVATTAIREVNGRTLINGNWLSGFPIEIKVIVDNPESLYHAMMSSQASDLFAYENFQFSASPLDEVRLPAYEKNYRVRFMEPVQEGS